MADEEPELGQTKAAEETAAQTEQDLNKSFTERSAKQLGLGKALAAGASAAFSAYAGQQGGGAAVGPMTSAETLLRGSGGDVARPQSPLRSKEQLQKIPVITPIPDLRLSFSRIQTGLDPEVDRVLQKSQNEVISAITQTYTTLQSRMTEVQRAVQTVDRNVRIVESGVKRYQSETSQKLEDIDAVLNKLRRAQEDQTQQFQKIDFGPKEEKDATKAAPDFDSLFEQWLKYKGAKALLDKIGGGLGIANALAAIGNSAITRTIPIIGTLWAMNEQQNKEFAAWKTAKGLGSDPSRWGADEKQWYANYFPDLYKGDQFVKFLEDKMNENYASNERNFWQSGGKNILGQEPWLDQLKNWWAGGGAKQLPAGQTPQAPAAPAPAPAAPPIPQAAPLTGRERLEQWQQQNPGQRPPNELIAGATIGAGFGAAATEPARGSDYLTNRDRGPALPETTMGDYNAVEKATSAAGTENQSFSLERMNITIDAKDRITFTARNKLEITAKSIVFDAADIEFRGKVTGLEKEAATGGPATPSFVDTGVQQLDQSKMLADLDTKQSGWAAQVEKSLGLAPGTLSTPSRGGPPPGKGTGPGAQPAGPGAPTVTPTPVPQFSAEQQRIQKKLVDTGEISESEAKTLYGDNIPKELQKSLVPGTAAPQFPPKAEAVPPGALEVPPMPPAAPSEAPAVPAVAPPAATPAPAAPPAAAPAATPAPAAPAAPTVTPVTPAPMDKVPPGALTPIPPETTVTAVSPTEKAPTPAAPATVAPVGPPAATPAIMPPPGKGGGITPAPAPAVTTPPPAARPSVSPPAARPGGPPAATTPVPPGALGPEAKPQYVYKAPTRPISDEELAKRIQGRAALTEGKFDHKSAIAGYVKRGFTEEQAAGIVGSMKIESGFNPTSVGDGGTSFGLHQWHNERWTALKGFAKARGADVNDPETQMDFFVHETTPGGAFGLGTQFGGGSEKHAGEALRSSGSVEDANIAMKGFERYAGGLQTSRQAFGEKALGEYKQALEQAPKGPVTPEQITQERAAVEKEQRTQLAKAAPAKGEEAKAATSVKPGAPAEPSAVEGIGGIDLSSQVKRGSANLMKGQFGKPGENITTIHTKSGIPVKVNATSAPYFKSFFDDLEARGYKLNPKTTAGFNLRQKRGGSSWSQHAYGNAIDVNWDQHPFHTQGVGDFPEDISDIAAKHGLSWGGDWSARSSDPMHFEWTGATPTKEQLATLQKENQESVKTAQAKAAPPTAGAAQRQAYLQTEEAAATAKPDVSKQPQPVTPAEPPKPPAPAAEKTTTEKVKGAAQELVGVKPAAAAEKPQTEAKISPAGAELVRPKPVTAEPAAKGAGRGATATPVHAAPAMAEKGIVPHAAPGPARAPITPAATPAPKAPAMAAHGVAPHTAPAPKLEPERGGGGHGGVRPATPTPTAPKPASLAPEAGGGHGGVQPGRKIKKEPSAPQSNPEHLTKQTPGPHQKSKRTSGSNHAATNRPEAGGDRGSGGGGGGAQPEKCHFCDLD